MKKQKLFLAALLAGITVSASVLGGCGSSEDSNQPGGSQAPGNSQNNQASGENQSTIKSTDTDQLAQPQKGEQIATFHIKNFGDITVRLFDKEAPKAVENFVTHAKNGYYNGVIFHRVMDDFMIQGGDPTGTGRGGESIWGNAFEDEFAENLMPVRGALCMANAGENTNGSQFFIVQTENKDVSSARVSLTEAQKNMFQENGGTPHLVYAHTVFGQVLDGMDVVDKIAAMQTDVNGRPTEDVVIESIDVTIQE